MTLNELVTSVNTLLTRVGSNRITGPEILTAVLNVISYFATQIADIIPAWTDSQTFNLDGTGDGKYCTYPDTNGKKRIFETKTAANTNNLPPTNPAITENTFWIEVSASAASSIQEWAAGVYGPNLVIVFHNHSTDGRGLYVLIEPTRPYASTNIETEITAGDWERIGGTSTGTGGPAIDAEYANIAAMLADQANQEQDALYFVADASADATVDADWALYQKLAASTGAIGDYRKLSEKESLDVVLNVLGTVLTGYVVGSNTALTAADTILQALQKLQGQINAQAVIGVQDLYIPASAMWPRTTTGCASLARTEIATSLLNIQTLDFDQSTQEHAQFTLVPPRKWNNGTVTAVFYWTAASGSGDVIWGIQGVANSNDDPLTTAFGTAQEVTDTLTATNDMDSTSATSAMTLAGSPDDADFLGFQIYRKAADGSDTLSADAKLIGVSIRFTVDAGKDA
jgi:hypothetical protein